MVSGSAEVVDLFSRVVAALGLGLRSTVEPVADMDQGGFCLYIVKVRCKICCDPLF